MNGDDLIIPIDKFTERYLAPAAKGLADKVKRGEKLAGFENEMMELAFGLPHDSGRIFVAVPKPAPSTAEKSASEEPDQGSR